MKKAYIFNRVVKTRIAKIEYKTSRGKLSTEIIDLTDMYRFFSHLDISYHKKYGGKEWLHDMMRNNTPIETKDGRTIIPNSIVSVEYTNEKDFHVSIEEKEVTIGTITKSFLGFKYKTNETELRHVIRVGELIHTGEVVEIAKSEYPYKEGVWNDIDGKLIAEVILNNGKN